jgi:hypothetical protein
LAMFLPRPARQATNVWIKSSKGYMFPACRKGLFWAHGRAEAFSLCPQRGNVRVRHRVLAQPRGHVFENRDVGALLDTISKARFPGRIRPRQVWPSVNTRRQGKICVLASLGQRANGLVFRYGNVAGVTTASKRDVEIPESQSTPAASGNGHRHSNQRGRQIKIAFHAERSRREVEAAMIPNSWARRPPF